MFKHQPYNWSLMKFGSDGYFLQTFDNRGNTYRTKHLQTWEEVLKMIEYLKSENGISL